MDIKRRKFFQRAGLGSAALLSLPVLTGAAKSSSRKEGQENEHRHDKISGPLASATVSFGQWGANGLDRFPDRVGGPPPLLPNQHALIPHISLIKAGGSVNFIIAGFHHVIVYGNGKKPSDVNTDAAHLISVTNPPGPPLIDDPDDRMYRGLDPSLPLLALQDRVEVVKFPEKGLYLVICGVLPHFANDDMYGWVKVV
jgi:hypothetical protein